MDQLEQSVLLEEEIYWEIKKEITYNKKSENFVDYLHKEKEVFDHPQPRHEKILSLIISIILGFVGLSSLIFSIEAIITAIFERPENPETFLNLPLEVATGLEISTGIATFLGICFSIITILYRAFYSTPNWSTYHDQMLALFKRLENFGLLNNFIFLTEVNGKIKFQLKKISADIDLDWIYPFIFNDFPPLMFELLLLAFLLPFFVSTTIGLYFAILDMIWVFMLFLGALFILILLGFEQSGLSIYRSWKKYSSILGTVKNKQQEIIHSLVLNKSDEMTIIRHQNNLNRLITMSSFPIPQIIRISAIIPLFGSLLGYLIAIAAIA